MWVETAKNNVHWKITLENNDGVFIKCHKSTTSEALAQMVLAFEDLVDLVVFWVEIWILSVSQSFGKESKKPVWTGPVKNSQAYTCHIKLMTNVMLTEQTRADHGISLTLVILHNDHTY